MFAKNASQVKTNPQEGLLLYVFLFRIMFLLQHSNGQPPTDGNPIQGLAYAPGAGST